MNYCGFADCDFSHLSHKIEYDLKTVSRETLYLLQKAFTDGNKYPVVITFLAMALLMLFTIC